MTHQCTAVFFADALSRERELTPDESSKLEGYMRRLGGSRRLWTAADDRELKGFIRQGLRATDIAEKTGRTAWAVRSRIRTLKRKERDRG